MIQGLSRWLAGGALALGVAGGGNPAARAERAAAADSLVLVGRGPVTWTRTTGLAVFRAPNGRDYALTGTSGSCTGCKGGRVYAWDVGDPARPALTDSVVVDAGTVASVAVNAAGTVAAITREGAESRRNGIVLLDLADPAHPRVAGEVWETLLGGARDLAWDGTTLYVASAGTNELVVLDASNPTAPREIGRWGLPSGEEGELRGVAVQGGMAYLAYADLGVVILDVGKGIRQGTPNRPRLVTLHRYRIDWNGRRVGATHVVEPYTGTDGRPYLLVADEIIPPALDRELARRGETGGYLHVLSLANPMAPREMATYGVRGSGIHDLHVDGSTLYVAAHNGGIRAVDLSGPLRGRMDRRELASLRTSDERARVPDVPFAMDVRVHGGHVFATDANSGLWIARRR